jgi:hypothetical protein
VCLCFIGLCWKGIDGGWLRCVLVYRISTGVVEILESCSCCWVILGVWDR